jgi:hypothetical protein
MILARRALGCGLGAMMPKIVQGGLPEIEEFILSHWK